MAELINKWEVVSKLISLENEYQCFKGSAFALSGEKMYRRICELEMEIGKTSGIELVHCKDCKYSGTVPYSGIMYCKNPMGRNGCVSTKDDAFCSHGERKENANKDD